MNPLVLYGAGKKSEEVYKQLRANDKIPVCLCDSNPMLFHKKTQFGGDSLEVLPFDEVMRQYPDCEFYVTPAPPVRYEIMVQLINSGLDKSRIVNYVPVKKGRRCIKLDVMLNLGLSDIRFCCNEFPHVRDPYIPIEDVSNKQLLSNIEQLREKTGYDMENPREGSLCYNCPQVKTMYYPEYQTITLSTINFGTGFFCQAKCCYCDNISQPLDARLRYTERILDFVGFLKQRGIIDRMTRIGMANGEITINPMQKEIVEIFCDNPCTFFTNALVYSEHIEKVLDKGRSEVNVSLDCGTSQTYEIVKGMASRNFEKVCSNIRRYAQHSPVDLKYIIIPGKNCGVPDLEGFLDLAGEVNAKVILSRDFYGIPQFNENLETVMTAASVLIRGAEERGLKITVPDFFEEARTLGG